MEIPVKRFLSSFNYAFFQHSPCNMRPAQRITSGKPGNIFIL